MPSKDSLGSTIPSFLTRLLAASARNERHTREIAARKIKKNLPHFPWVGRCKTTAGIDSCQQLWSKDMNMDSKEKKEAGELKTLTIADLELAKGALKPLKYKGQWFEGEY
jgi:hypothetical protein